ncbi:thiamine phosphate synthase [Pontixanthobacter sp.]|uniref:thiamine phosphate synthase n=1 Tax=Pontixanthobacter sp. TaxID=2792078 RepID=UPI003C7E95E9
MAQNQTAPTTLPALWLISDARNDAALESSLKALPRGSGFIYRHYHLSATDRRTRFTALAALARKYAHIVILADTPVIARKWGADGIYGPARRMPNGDALIKLAAAHNARDIVAADRAGADAILLSPVFATRSHPGARSLGAVRFRLLARKTSTPVIALGGMTREHARALGWSRWAAIDGLVSTQDS